MASIRANLRPARASALAQSRRRSSVRQTTALGVLASVLAAGAMLAVHALQPGFAPKPLAAALGARRPDAALIRRPVKGVDVRIGRRGLAVSTSHGRVSLLGLARHSSGWARYQHGAERTTPFGRETVVVT